jgi:hypothetical protein
MYRKDRYAYSVLNRVMWLTTSLRSSIICRPFIDTKTSLTYSKYSLDPCRGSEESSRNFFCTVAIFDLVTVIVFVSECKLRCLLYGNHIVHSFVYSYCKKPPLACCCNNWNMATRLCLFWDHGHILHGTVRWRLTPCCNHDKGFNVRRIQFPDIGNPVPTLEAVFTNLIPIQQFSHIKVRSDWLWIDRLWSCNQMYQ